MSHLLLLAIEKKRLEPNEFEASIIREVKEFFGHLKPIIGQSGTPKEPFPTTVGWKFYTVARYLFMSLDAQIKDKWVVVALGDMAGLMERFDSLTELEGKDMVTIKNLQLLMARIADTWGTN